MAAHLFEDLFSRGSSVHHPDLPYWSSIVVRKSFNVVFSLRTQRDIPFDRVSEAVELDQIYALHSHALEGIVDVALGVVIAAAPGLGCEEEAPGVLSKPRSDPQFRVAVARRDIDMVDAVAQQDLERLISFVPA